MTSSSDYGATLHHLVSIMSHESDQLLLEQLGIGLAQYKIMQVVHERPHVQQRAIARELGQTEASISRQVKLLHEKSMLMTRINPQNQREHLTDLTEKGIRTIIAASGIIERYYAQLAAGLSSKQLAQLEELLGSLHDQACTTDSHV